MVDENHSAVAGLEVVERGMVYVYFCHLETIVVINIDKRLKEKRKQLPEARDDEIKL